MISVAQGGDLEAFGTARLDHAPAAVNDWRIPSELMESELPRRRSARLLVVDADNRLLLFRYADEHGDPFWATVGGELVGDETYEDAALRELHEETGLNLPLGPIVREREAIFQTARSGPALWQERYFVVHSPNMFVPERDGWTDEEQQTIVDHRWWAASELAELSEKDVKPPWLREVLSDLTG